MRRRLRKLAYRGWHHFTQAHVRAYRATRGRIGKSYKGAPVLLLDHVGLDQESVRLEKALARVYGDGTALTPDQGGRATTKEMAAAVLAAYRNQ